MLVDTMHLRVPSGALSKILACQHTPQNRHVVVSTHMGCGTHAQLFPTRQAWCTTDQSITKGNNSNLLPAIFAGHHASKEATATAPLILCPATCQMLRTTTQTWGDGSL